MTSNPVDPNLTYENYTPGPISRRAFLAGAAGMGVAAGLMAMPAAAAPAGTAARSLVRNQTTPAGQIILARTMSELTTLHPATARFTSALAIAYHVNEGLTKFSPNFEILPGLATDWTISDDQLTFTFTLRPGVQWHDGTPVTSADVKFTIDAAGADDSQFPAKPTIDAYIASVETPDDATVVITLTKPFSPLLTVLAEQLTVLPKHLLETDVYNAAFSEKPVGTGPYKVTDRQAAFINLEANENYWGEKPFTQKIILRDSPDAAAQQAGLLAGELDVIGYVPTTMAGLEQQGYVVFRGPAGSVHGINIDLGTPLLQDVNVRKALQLSLDRERILSVLYAGGVDATTCVSPAYGAYHDADLAPITRDAAAAGALLETAGWVAGGDGIREKDGQKLSFQYQAWVPQNFQDIATIAQASWLEAGIGLEIITVELANLADTMSGRFQLTTVGWPLTSDPIVGLSLLFQSTEATMKDGGTRNVFGYKNPTVDSLLTDAYATTNVDERVAIAHQIQEQVYNDLPLIPFAHPAYQMIAKPGITLDETGTGALSSIGPGYFMNRWDAAD
jgi:peptide/nickel transport system substrate-binding protein